MIVIEYDDNFYKSSQVFTFDTITEFENIAINRNIVQPYFYLPLKCNAHAAFNHVLSNVVEIVKNVLIQGSVNTLLF